MFERYTEKARRVIFFARYEASLVGASAIEAEHILLGILREDRFLVQGLFGDAQSKVEAIRSEVAARTISRDKIHASVDLPLAPGAKRALSYAADESEKLHNRHIGTEHLMLGLIRDEGSFASEILRSRGVTPESVVAVIDKAAVHNNEEKSDAISFEAAQTGERLSRPLWLLVDRLAQKGLLSREEFMGELLGKSAPLGVLTAFNLMLALLVRKGVISADERREISLGQS